MNIDPMLGKRFGRLLVQVRADVKKHHRYYICLCACGTAVTVCGGSLRRGRTKSCGCLHKDISRGVARRRGQRGVSYHLLDPDFV